MAIYKDFNIQPENSLVSSDVVTNVKDTISSGMWENGSGTLTSFFTSSTQSGSSGAYYLDVYGTNPQSDSTAKAQFSVAYGHVNGSGSAGALGIDGNRASATIYRQLVNTLLGPNEDKFVFANSGGSTPEPDYVYAISIAREQLREKMDPGNWELHLSGSGIPGQYGLTKLIDDSDATTNPTINQGGRVFNVVSGSIAGGTASTYEAASDQPGGGLGLFYPDLGIFVLSAAQLDASASLATERTVTGAEDNVNKFFESLVGGAKFQARREENISSTHYFCRVRNKRYNFSANPTFFTQSDGSLTIPSFHKDPKVYITTVGLYNDENELLAVAKLSKPLLKSYAREAIIKVKLDF